MLWSQRHVVIDAKLLEGDMERAQF